MPGKSKGDANEWFKSRFGNSIQQNAIKKNNEDTNRKYDDVKGELAKRLAIRRHEELERRYSFYNAENEIFEEDDAGEDELMAGDEADTIKSSSPDRKKRKIQDEKEEIDEDKLMENNGKGGDEDEIGEERKENSSFNEEEEDEEIDELDEEEFDGEEEEEEPLDEEKEEEEEPNKEETIAIKKRRIIEDDEEEEESTEKEGNIQEKKHIIEDDEEEEESTEKAGNIQEKRRIIEDDEEEEGMGEKGNDENIEEVPPAENSVGHNLRDENGDDLFTTAEDDEMGNHNRETERIDEDVEEYNEMIYDEEERFEVEEDVGQRVVKAQQKMKELLDEEASLSGDDVGSDLDDDRDEGLDEYEAEEGDLDELPADEDIRDNLVRQYMKHQKDADDRKLLKIQEAFFADSDLHGKGGGGDRSFRLRMHDDSKVDWAKILGTFGEEEEPGQEEGAPEEGGEGAASWREKRLEMLKWKLEEEKKRRKRERKEEEGDGDWEEEVGNEEEGREGSTDLETELAADGVDELFKLGKQILLEREPAKTAANHQISSDRQLEDPSHPPTPPPQSSSSSHHQPTTLRFSSAFSKPKRDSLLTKANFLGTLIKDGQQGSGGGSGGPAMTTLFTTQKP